ncbi:aminodeoxychorismate synthase component I [Rhizorhapis sp. SPR117]|uniref:aminodeoxychorismate synthase component I n=1 Tax=Rhizorhapis sp. SPR117 TaxID=2912611 RepID=UPI001F022385|nr:aminodeoxychorismate synthase component I [Rhizorhapis sp. SPR117]
MLPATSVPFLLFDDARPQGGAGARLYADPRELIVAHRPEEVQPALDQVAAAGKQGLHAAGYLAYEAGYALEPRLASLAQATGEPLLWFGLFDCVQHVPVTAIPSFLPAPSPNPPLARPLIDQKDYAAAFECIQSWIEAGDVYQVNFTFPCSVELPQNPLSLYAAIRDRAGAGYGGIVYTGTQWLLSFSPELFFIIENGTLTARPMKGTTARGDGALSDMAAIAGLRDDPKQRAENLMIVDLLRNDLSRVSEAGSVEVPALFHIETYPTVHQMTSTVTARLQPDLGPVDVLRTIFPCGSITGAPKLRAMEIIHAVEAGPRGVYTGSIGHISPDGDAVFNVAIRTICVNEEHGAGRIGLGSGIVADSVMQAEWDECLEKGKFLGNVPNG